MADRGAAVRRDDRRSEYRLACSKALAILPIADGSDAWTLRAVELVDCSPNGIALITSEPMVVGDEFVVKFETGQISLARYTTRHCCRTASGHFQIGAELSGLVGAAEEYGVMDVMKTMLRDR